MRPTAPYFIILLCQRQIILLIKVKLQQRGALNNQKLEKTSVTKCNSQVIMFI